MISEGGCFTNNINKAQQGVWSTHLYNVIMPTDANSPNVIMPTDVNSSVIM